MPVKGEFLSIGFGNAVVLQRIVAIVTPNSASGKRLRDEAKNTGNLIDVSMGRKIRSILVMDSGHVILSTLNTETIVSRVSQDQKADSKKNNKVELVSSDHTQ